MLKRFSLSLTLLGLLILAIPVSAQYTPEFEQAPCPVNIPFGFVEGTDPLGIECGFVAVPEFHANPDGNQIRVAVAIIHSISPAPASDPLIMEQGGPGGSTLDLFVQLAPLFQTILAERDIVLVEQRGTKHSEPALMCPELTELAIEFLDDDLPNDEILTLQLDAYDACFNRLTDEGVNLSAYNSVENAADIMDVADALGYDEINFYGVSYGTMLGQHLLRDFEDRIRSIIFDAVVPLELNFIPDIMATGSEAINTLFASCEADSACNDLYPNLADTFWETYENLNANPVIIETYDPETGIDYDALVTGDVVLEILRTLQYTTEFVPSLPALIYATSEGDFEWLERLYGLVAIDSSRDIADAMNISVLCAEDADFTDEDIFTEGIRPEIVERQTVFITSIQASCELAEIETLDNYVDEPVISDVPSLVTSGGFDPITPARYADILADNLSNSTNLVFPTVGHGALLGGQCPLSIMASFISDPESDLNTSCIDSMELTFNELTTDPTGQLQFGLPQGFEDVSNDTYARYEDDSRNINVSVIALEEVDLPSAISEALATVIREDFDRPALIEIDSEDGFGQVINEIYQDGATFILVYALRVEDVTSVILVEFPPLQLNNIDPILIPVAVNMFSVD
ncbi:MAG: hypothetical protein Phog2KO_21280 [Phototrophicaceae bacterium]